MSGKIIFNCGTLQLAENKWNSLKFLIIMSRFALIFKILKCNYAPFLKKFFIARKISYNLRSKNNFVISHFNNYKSAKAFIHWAPRMWAKLPEHIKNLSNIEIFTLNIQNWLSDNIDCVNFL